VNVRFEPGSRIDRYEIMEELGEGAYAETYLARDTTADRLVVLKSPNPTLFADPAVFQRYRREADIARSLDHPGVQRALDLAENRTEQYLVLEYVDGTNLRVRMRQFGSAVPMDLIVRWARQLASVLDYLHERGIVHRDLKPENILVDADDNLKVADFGTALLDGARRLTWKHMTDGLGTPDYMSPEQIQGERGDHRSDIYAWGIMIYEMLAGHVPFRGDNWMATMAGHLTKTPEPVGRARRDCPPGLAAIVMHAMRRDPDNRYQDAKDLIVDLDRYESLDASTYDLSPEPAIGGLNATASTRGMWVLAAMISLSFIVVCALVVVLSVVLS
jgi:eukaryotic-like serine/threonine-protein kinase